MMPTSNGGNLNLDMDLDAAPADATTTTTTQRVHINPGDERDADGFFLQTSGSTTFGQRPEFDDAFYDEGDAPTENSPMAATLSEEDIGEDYGNNNASNEADEQYYDDQDDEVYEEEEIEIYEDDYYDDEDDYDSLEDLDHVHDNPHKDSIVSNLGMKSPAIREMNENEIFAKKAGLRYSQGYDVQCNLSEVGSVVSVGDHSNAQHHGDNMMASPFAFNPGGATSSKKTGRVGGFFSRLFGRNRCDEEPGMYFPDGNADDILSDNSGDLLDDHGNVLPPNASYLRRSANIDEGENVDQLRLLAGQLNADWRGDELMAPALARRLRDFQFAQEKRRKKYGNERPWGILGLYDHLASVRMDVEWAEDAAWRRANGEPYCAWAEFEASKNQGFNRPFFTYFILFICTGVLIASIGVNGWKVEPVSINPMIGPSAETLVQLGAKETYLIVNENEAWRLVSPMVLHAGLIHYFLNMLALWFIGSAVEQSHGFIPAMILFILPAIGGAVLSAIFLPEYISVGASGGIFGLIGACLSDIVMNWNLIFSDFVNEGGSKKRHAMVLLFLFLDIVINCLLGITPLIDNFTHLGGMIFGFLCGMSTMERVSHAFFGVEEKRCWGTFKNIVARFLGLIISIAGIMAATIILLEGDGVTNPCESCSALSCISFPPWNPQDNRWWYCDDCSQVTAEARINPATGIFHALDMTCPDGTIESIDLSDLGSKDKAWLERNLPNFCRQNCDSIYS